MPQSRPHHDEAQTTYRADIDGLRGVAVLAVVAFHTFPRAVPGGFAGVDVFFVISGFLISTILLSSFEEGRVSIAGFYARRARRIFPALLVVLAFCLVIGWFRASAAYYSQIGEHTAAAAAFVSNLLLWSEAGYFDRSAITKPLLHLWSLGVEEQFYLLWPWTIALLYRVRARIPLTLSVVAIGALSFGLNVAAVGSHPTAVFYSPVTRLWELAIGAALACQRAEARPALPDTRFPRARDAASLVGSCLLAASLALLSDERPFPGYWGLLPTTGTALLVAAGPQAVVNRLLARRPLVWIGLISYPLYLWHWPLISFVTTMTVLQPRAVVLTVALLVSFALAWLTFRFVETPVRASRRRRTVALLAAAMAGVGMSGLNIHLDHGVEYAWERLYRYQVCFLDEHQDVTAFTATCVDPKPLGDSAPLVLLWGDSHAAALYPGLRHEQEAGHFRLAQFNATGCPPIVGMQVSNKPQCKGINDAVLETIQRAPPELVVMAGYWKLYDARSGSDALDYVDLTRTIELVHAAGVRDIVVVGQLPTFSLDVPTVALQAFAGGGTDRTFDHFDFGIRNVDHRLRATVAHTPARFVSPLDLLCDERGCLVSTSPTILTPIAWDYGHLTQEGSIYLVELAGLPGLTGPSPAP